MPENRWFSLELTQVHAPYRVVRTFLEYQPRTVFGGLDVLLEVGVIYLVPDAQRAILGFLDREVRETVEVRGVVPQRLFSQTQEALQVPRLDVLFLRVHVDREVDVIGDEDPVAIGGLRQPGLQHVQALHYQDVGPPD